MSIPTGKVFQVFEAGQDEVHRLYVTNSPALDISKVDVVDNQGDSILKEAVFLDAEKSDTLSRCLSLRLPAGSQSYRVT